MPYGEVSTELVEEIFQNGTGVQPLEVLVLNDQDVLVDLAEGVSATEIAMAIHGDAKLRNQDIRIGCIIAGRDSLITAEKKESKLECRRKS